jgi:hypothetical protein
MNSHTEGVNPHIMGMNSHTEGVNPHRSSPSHPRQVVV